MSARETTEQPKQDLAIRYAIASGALQASIGNALAWLKTVETSEKYDRHAVQMAINSLQTGLARAEEATK